MFEMVKAILEIIKDVTDFSKFSTSNKKTKIGVRLFSVYTNLNQILITGYDIVEKLESYVKECQYRSKMNKELYQLYIKDLLKEQSINMGRFVFSARDMILELNIINGKFVMDIKPLISGKISALRDLLNIFEAGSLPIDGPTSLQLKELVEKWNKLSISDEFWDWEEDYISIRKEIIKKENIKNNYKQIKKYLDNSDLRKSLDEIKSALLLFRDTLEKNFTLSDILVEVGKNGYGKIKIYDDWWWGLDR
jgi:hypothetical protein